MCGIYGSVDLLGKEEAYKNLLKFKYRGPDATGYYFQSGVFLGTNRLSIIDIHERANQPFVSPDKKRVLIFNGEIYNYREISNELKKNGVTFTTNSDTEVILKGYEQWGIEVLKRLKGMFALAIYDLGIGKMYLARDHVGMKPLYYYQSNAGLIFSSEIKGLVTAIPSKQLSTRSFKLATALGYIPSPYTIYENVYKLEKGTVMCYDLKNKDIDDFTKFHQNDTSKIDTVSGLRDLIEKKTLQHLTSDAAVGLFFSGGNDSTLIASILKKYDIHLNTYSIILENKQDDAYFIDKVSSYLGLKPKKINFDFAAFEKALQDIQYLIDEPTMDSSMLAIYALSVEASKDVKVVLSGEGADEFFFGYTRHKSLADLNPDETLGVINNLYSLPLMPSAKTKIAKLLTTICSKGYSRYLIETSKSCDVRCWDEAIKLFVNSNAEPLKLDQEFYLENDLLRKMDFATSYASIEGRMPFLDPDIINASRNFEMQFRADHVPKGVLKQILSTYMEGELVYRNKSGLGLPHVRFFQNSTSFMEGLRCALNELVQYKELTEYVPTLSPVELVTKHPYHAFLLYTYWKSINNLSRA